MAIALDGHITGTSLTSAVSAKLTTANTNDVLIVATISQGLSVVVSSISDTAGLTWAKRKAVVFNASNDLEVWWATSSAILSSDNITVTFSGVPSAAAMSAFGVSGANFASPWDTNASIPKSTTGSVSAPAISGISTSNANAMILGIAASDDNTAQTAVATFTLIDSVSNSVLDQLSDEYKVVSSIQSSISASFPNSVTNAWGMIGDALQQASALTFWTFPEFVDIPIPKREVVGY